MTVRVLCIALAVALISILPLGAQSQHVPVGIMDTVSVLELQRAIDLGRRVRTRSGEMWLRLDSLRITPEGLTFAAGDFIPFAQMPELQVWKRSSTAMGQGAVSGAILVGGLLFVLSKATTRPCSGLGDAFCGVSQEDVLGNTIKGFALGGVLGALLGARERWVTIHRVTF